jgi:oligoribonuclease NrnB/cAMP/cGMP phosphodiesterase (DHH superfamily)
LKHIIHHNDLDGICAAAVARYYYQALAEARRADKPEIHYYETNYNRPADTTRMRPGDRVIIVDFSYPPAEMEKIDQVLGARGSIVWIDHHKTAERYGYKYPGLRDFADYGKSGCELTWDYYFGGGAPAAVRWIGDYDSWRLEDEHAKVFYEGAKVWLLDPLAPQWEPLFNDNQEALRSILEAGRTATRYRDAYTAGMRRSYGFETRFAGHRCYATNLYGFGSPGFGEAFERYPIVIAFIFDGRRFTVSLYSRDIDVGEICKGHGGGGHKGAAGFVCERLPFAHHELQINGGG